MKKETIKEIGTIDIERLEATEGTIEMRMPVDVIGEQLDTTLDTMYEDFSKKYPTVENIYYEARMVLSFGRANPDFSLMLIIFYEEEKHTEIWDELEVTLSDEAKKQIRKIAWDKLGETLFNL